MFKLFRLVFFSLMKFLFSNKDYCVWSIENKINLAEKMKRCPFLKKFFFLYRRENFIDFHISFISKGTDQLTFEEGCAMFPPSKMYFTFSKNQIAIIITFIFLDEKSHFFPIIQIIYFCMLQHNLFFLKKLRQKIK